MWNELPLSCISLCSPCMVINFRFHPENSKVCESTIGKSARRLKKWVLGNEKSVGEIPSWLSNSTWERLAWRSLWVLGMPSRCRPSWRMCLRSYTQHTVAMKISDMNGCCFVLVSTVGSSLATDAQLETTDGVRKLEELRLEKTKWLSSTLSGLELADKGWQ